MTTLGYIIYLNVVILHNKITKVYRKTTLDHMNYARCILK